MQETKVIIYKLLVGSSETTREAPEHSVIKYVSEKGEDIVRGSRKLLFLSTKQVFTCLIMIS